MVKFILTKSPDEWETTKQACRHELVVYMYIGQESVCELPTYDISCPSAKLERFSLVFDKEISSIIMSASSASCQLDPIPTWLVKQCTKELAPVFAKMINSSLISGVIPENWKLTLVIPLLKKHGLEAIFNSFRLVSNLPFISKTAEKVVIPQVIDHCEANAPLPRDQSSYRQHHSTKTALLKVQNDILLKMDKQEVTLLILLDLSAAFDSIDHGTMLQILENDFGITDTALWWLSSFLVSRKQRVLVNGR